VPAPQGAVLLQAVRHADVLAHMLLWHALEVGVVQPPLPSHTDAAVRTPLAHTGPAHIPLEPG
jgi:hypothetical protein